MTSNLALKDQFSIFLKHYLKTSTTYQKYVKSRSLLNGCIGLMVQLSAKSVNCNPIMCHCKTIHITWTISYGLYEYKLNLMFYLLLYTFLQLVNDEPRFKLVEYRWRLVFIGSISNRLLIRTNLLCEIFDHDQKANSKVKVIPKLIPWCIMMV